MVLVDTNQQDNMEELFPRDSDFSRYMCSSIVAAYMLMHGDFFTT